MNASDFVRKIVRDEILKFRLGGGGGVRWYHKLLAHEDATEASVVRGDIITGQGATTRWARLAKGTSGYFLKSDGTDILWAQVSITNLAGYTVQVKTTTYTAAFWEAVICNSTTAFTVTLPSATGSGKPIAVKNINTGMITVDGNSSDTIDGELTQSLNQWDGVQLLDYAANKWAII